MNEWPLDQLAGAFYAIYTPNGAARKWATHVLRILGIPKKYISKRHGVYYTGDPEFIARYEGTVLYDQYQLLVTDYLPYAPIGVSLYCPQYA